MQNFNFENKNFSFPIISGPCEKRSPIKHDDNLRTGEGDFVTPEKQKYIPAERPQQVRPEDNLRPEGTFDRPEKTAFKPAERPKAVKPTDQVKKIPGSTLFSMRLLSVL